MLLNAYYSFHMDYTTTDSSKVPQDVKGHYIWAIPGGVVPQCVAWVSAATARHVLAAWSPAQH